MSNNVSNLILERKYWTKGLRCCGVDEVGRGCIAGPVVAAAVVFPKDHTPNGKIKDSKKLTEKQREELFDFIIEESEDFGIGLVSASEIDEIGIVFATEKAMESALNLISADFSETFIDGRDIKDFSYRHQAIIGGDSKVYSISAASIIAKVFRDRLVLGLDNVFSDYGFSSHKGYGTKAHYMAISSYGLTTEHRKSFLKKMISSSSDRK